MSLEEAEYILNEVVIEEPSISGYTYISTEDINKAIDKILEEKLNFEKRIKELEEEKETLKIKIVEKEMELENNNLKIYSLANIKKLIKYIKKVVKPLFLLEN